MRKVLPVGCHTCLSSSGSLPITVRNHLIIHVTLEVFEHAVERIDLGRPEGDHQKRLHGKTFRSSVPPHARMVRALSFVAQQRMNAPPAVPPLVPFAEEKRTGIGWRAGQRAGTLTAALHAGSRGGGCLLGIKPGRGCDNHPHNKNGPDVRSRAIHSAT
jgi:hypothetical protein